MSALSASAVTQRTSLCPRRRQGDVQRPLLPAHLVLSLAKEVGLPSLLLGELHYNLTTAALLVRGLHGAHQLDRLLVDERLEVDIVDGRKGEVEQIAREGRYGGEVAVEEDGVENCCEGSAGSRGDANRSNSTART